MTAQALQQTYYAAGSDELPLGGDLDDAVRGWLKNM